jgi:hypothetical protein
VLEAIMAGVVGVVAVAAFAFFVFGVIVAVMALIARAIRREDRGLTLTGQAPDRLSRGVRRLTGVGLRDVDTDLERLTRELVRQ